MQLLSNIIFTSAFLVSTSVGAQEMLAERVETPPQQPSISTAETGIAKTKEVFLWLVWSQLGC